MEATRLTYQAISEILTSNEDPTTIYELITLLGEGSFGSVWKVLNKNTGAIFAAKIVPLAEEIDNIKSEIAVLKECCNQYILNFYGSYLKDNNLWIITEYCAAGSAADLMRATKKPFNEVQIASILTAVLKGLEYLHGSKKIHRDVKAGNVLLDQYGNVKLGDFGVSAHQLVTISDPCDTVTGTPFWMSPEVISENKYGKKTDIWSLGITAIELAEMEPPYSHIHPYRAMYVIKNKPARGLTNPEQWSNEFNKFVERCLTINPKERPSAKELLQDEFITKTRGNGVICELVANCLDAIEEYRLQNTKKGIKGQKKNNHSFVEENIVEDNDISSEDDLMNNDADNMVSGTMIVHENLNEIPSGTIVIHNNEPAANGAVIIHGEQEISKGAPFRHPTIDFNWQAENNLSQMNNILFKDEEEQEVTTTTSSVFVMNGFDTMICNPNISNLTNLELLQDQVKQAEKIPYGNHFKNHEQQVKQRLTTPRVKIEIPFEYQGLSSASIQSKIKILERDMEIEIMMIKQSYTERIQNLQRIYNTVQEEEQSKKLNESTPKNLINSIKQIQNDPKSLPKRKQNDLSPSGKNPYEHAPRQQLQVHPSQNTPKYNPRQPIRADESAVKTPIAKNGRNYQFGCKPDISSNVSHKTELSPIKPSEEARSQKVGSSKILGLINKNNLQRKNETPSNPTNNKLGFFVNYGGISPEKSPARVNKSNESSKNLNSARDSNEPKYSFQFAPQLADSPSIKAQAAKTNQVKAEAHNSKLNLTDSVHNQLTQLAYSASNISPKNQNNSHISYEKNLDKRVDTSKEMALDNRSYTGMQILGNSDPSKIQSRTSANRLSPINEFNRITESYKSNLDLVTPKQNISSKDQSNSFQLQNGVSVRNPVQLILRRK